MNALQRWKRWLIPDFGTSDRRIEPGITSYSLPRDGALAKFHLRVEPDGWGMLLCAASEAVRLSPDGVVAAKAILESKGNDAIHRLLKRSDSAEVIAQVRDAIAGLGKRNHRFPLMNLIDPEAAPHASNLSAPLQADIEIGDPTQTLAILDRLWKAGVPHVRFHPADQPHAVGLDRLVRHAEDLGMITGVRFAACRHATDEGLGKLCDVGLDYVVMPWLLRDDWHREVYGTGDLERLLPIAARARELEMASVVELPLTWAVLDVVAPALEELICHGVETFEGFAIVSPIESNVDISTPWRPFAASEMRQAATIWETLALNQEAQLIWLPPECLLTGESVPLRIRRGPRCSSELSIRVTATGEVLPPRGKPRSAGNLLHQAWNDVWKQVVYRGGADTVPFKHCEQCPRLNTCTSACPADSKAWSLSE